MNNRKNKELYQRFTINEEAEEGVVQKPENRTEQEKQRRKHSYYHAFYQPEHPCFWGLNTGRSCYEGLQEAKRIRENIKKLEDLKQILRMANKNLINDWTRPIFPKSTNKKIKAISTLLTAIEAVTKGTDHHFNRMSSIYISIQENIKIIIPHNPILKLFYRLFKFHKSKIHRDLIRFFKRNRIEDDLIQLVKERLRNIGDAEKWNDHLGSLNNLNSIKWRGTTHSPVIKEMESRSLCKSPQAKECDSNQVMSDRAQNSQLSIENVEQEEQETGDNNRMKYCK